MFTKRRVRVCADSSCRSISNDIHLCDGGISSTVGGVGGVSHHLLWLWDGDSTEELVVAENLLMSRDQISCRGREESISTSFQIIPVNVSDFLKDKNKKTLHYYLLSAQTVTDQKQQLTDLYPESS